MKLVLKNKMSAPTLTGVELGFVDKIQEKWKLRSHFFPSKVGGKPAWLCLKPVPTINEIKCGKCEKPCVFLMQVYAPFVDKDGCFHRTIFLLICRDAQCSTVNDSRNVIALRSQLCRSNEFYPSEPPDDSSFSRQSGLSAETFQPLCCVCGCSGPKKCAKCQQAAYCSKAHQTIDWKAGHKRNCSTLGDDLPGVAVLAAASPNNLLFPEYELVTESENSMESDKPEKTDAEKIAEYKEYMTAHQEPLLSGKDSTRDLEDMATGDVDKQFSKFKKRIDHEPEQVLRYERDGQPLWVSAEHQPTTDDIPKCSCGADRRFEFQVMSQLLNHLNVDTLGDSIDWGTMAIYTCTDSCSPTQGYEREFVWKQDFSADSLHTAKKN